MATASKPQQEEEQRNRRRTIEGIVVSDKADKTRVVNVERRVRHPFYEKVMTRHSKFYVHDEGNESHAGDLVEIMSTRPMSKLKRWRLVRVIRKQGKTA
ncbi:MAG: 30S ribosomal protein S17 [Elusimicrobia bacterium]|nr:30S ribosomal protein S17 [Elusimicrobiota bacterium]